MKYALLDMTYSTHHYINIGDNVQIWALERLLIEELNVKTEEIVRIPVTELPYYQGEPVVLLINFFFFSFFQDVYPIFPASPRITPVFLGVHFSVEFFAPEEIDYLKKYAPIGCRDIKTLRTMEKYKIPAYLYGCITLTLPEREPELFRDAIFLVDVHPEIMGLLPDSIQKNAIKTKQVFKYGRQVTRNESLEMEKEGRALYKRYREEASLVITSRRLHCVLPCLAEGIPVVYLCENDEIDPRFHCFQKMLPLYSKNDVETIVWSPVASDLRELKQAMIALAVDRCEFAFSGGAIWDDFFQKESIKEQIKVISSYLSCEIGTEHEALQIVTSVVQENITALQEGNGYILWGMTAIAETFYSYLHEHYPEIPLIAVVDEFSNGVFHEFTPIRGEDLKKLDKYKGIPLIITPSQSKEHIEAKLQQDEFSHCGVRLFPFFKQKENNEVLE